MVFSKYNLDEFQGGPSGFIRQNILDKKIEGLITLQTLQQNYKPDFFKKVKKKLSQVFNEEEKNSWLVNFTGSAGKTYQYYNCAKFDYIYFHDIFSLYGCLNYISKTQKIILQSHAPELVSEEFKNLDSGEDSINKIKEIELVAFKKADHLIFPNPDSALIYKSLICKSSKINYILSSSQSINNAFTIPLDKDSVNLLFVGRRNHIKGFDVLIKTFEKTRVHRQNINLFLAGEGEEKNQQGVISLGKVNPANWIASVDFVINTNGNSYFDLSVMEVLSIGTPIILTLTGGHTFFKDKSSGIITLDTLDFNSLYMLLLNIQKPTLADKAEMVWANQNLYKKYFTTELYKERMEKFIAELV